MPKPEVVFEDQWTKVICGDIVDVLTGQDMVNYSSIQMAMTSVPYLRQRRYSAEGAWGWEDSVNGWVEHMVLLGKKLKYYLKADGSFWFNSGDKWGGSNAGSDYGDKRFNEAPKDYNEIKDSKLKKDNVNRKGNLMMLPQRVAIRYTDEEIYTLVNIPIWWKTNRAVQSYNRKFVDTYEPLYFFVKDEAKYKFNRDTIGVQVRGNMELMDDPREEEEVEELALQMSLNHDMPELWHPSYDADHPPPFGTPEYKFWYENVRRKQAWHDHKDDAVNGQRFDSSRSKVLKRPDGANPGDVWPIAIKRDPFFGRAGIPAQRIWPAWPIELCTLPILACTDLGDTVIDPFCGSGTLGVAAKQLGRKSILVDIDIESCRIAAVRVMKATATLEVKQEGLL